MPLTDKGKKIMTAMKKEYGPEKGERVFYASANKGKIKGVHKKTKKTKKVLTKNDIDKFATAEEKEFLKEKEKDYGAILNRGMKKKANQFNLKKLYFDPSRPDDETDEEFSKNLKGKYKPREIKKFLKTREDIDQFATEEEKKFLKEYFDSEEDRDIWMKLPLKKYRVVYYTKDPTTVSPETNEVWVMARDEESAKEEAIDKIIDIGDMPEDPYNLVIDDIEEKNF